MKKYIIIFLSIACNTHIQSQSIQRNVIGSAGKTISNSGFAIRSTAGEAIVAKGANAVYQLNQGFQQGVYFSTALPISGLDFTAYRRSASVVELQWKTLSELNNKGFYIERKLEYETGFSTLQFMSCKSLNGTSNTSLHYNCTDNNTYTGNSYYRLKQEDIDGRISYSIIRLINGELASTTTLKVWPIPATDYVNVILNGSNKDELVELLDINGKLLKMITLSNQMPHQFDVSGLSSGIYFVKVTGDENLIQKIIIKKR